MDVYKDSSQFKKHLTVAVIIFLYVIFQSVYLILQANLDYRGLILLIATICGNTVIVIIAAINVGKEMKPLDLWSETYLTLALTVNSVNFGHFFVPSSTNTIEAIICVIFMSIPGVLCLFGLFMCICILLISIILEAVKDCHPCVNLRNCIKKPESV